MNSLIGDKLSGFFVYIGAAIVGVYVINLYSRTYRQTAAENTIRQATEEDTLTGNQAIPQFGGFQQPARIPSLKDMENVERRDFNSAGPRPNSVAISHSRARRKGRN